MADGELSTVKKNGGVLRAEPRAGKGRRRLLGEMEHRAAAALNL
jgi:hypothetical protein